MTRDPTITHIVSGAHACPPAPRRSLQKGIVGALTVTLVAGATVLASATAATASTSYGVIATVPMGSGLGDGMGIDTANHSLYISRPAAGVVSVVDLTTNTVKTTIPVSGPGRIAVDSSAHRAYVVSSGALSVIDTTSNTVVSSIGGLVNPVGVAVDPSTHVVYVANYNSEVVSVIDTTATPVTLTNTGYAGSRPWAVAVDPTTHKAYAATLFGGSLAVVSGTSITNNIGGFVGPIQVTVDPVGRRAYVVNNNIDGVSVVDTDTETNLGTFNAGSGPSDMAVDPATGTGYVTNRNDDTVSVVDLTDNSISGTVPVGDNPQSVEVDPTTHRAYVMNVDNTISVIALLSSQEITFTSTPPAQPVAGTSYTAIATGGASSVPVTFSTASSACTVTAAGTVTFTHVGGCVVSADQAGDYSYSAAPTVDQSMTVGVGSQAITFTSLPPSPASVGGSYTVDTAGGGSTEPVTLSVDDTTSNACSITDDVVSFDHVGSCTIAADQAGDADYTAAPQALQQLTVVHEATTTLVTLPDSSVVFGEPATATAAVGNTHDGSVQFTVDGAPVGAPVAAGSDGTATSPELTGSNLAVGAHQVGAVYTPTDTDRYAESSATPVTLTVDKAATTSTMTVTGTDITAAVAPVAPGAGDPTGTVRFYLAGTKIGRASLTGGTATLDYHVPAGRTRAISTVYAGNAAFTGSSASTARRDPAITATVSSDSARRDGWYSSPVTVTFTCAQTSAPLTKACPAPVTRSRNAAGQSVTRTIVASDGGAATAVVRGINVDTVRPVVRLTGVRAGATYFAAGPAAGCRATDRLSGVATCTVSRTTDGHRAVYVATATDRAGNRSSTRLVVRTLAVVIREAAMKRGHFVVHRGRTYTVLVEAATRPSYVYAAPTARPPAGGGIPFKRIGKNSWALGVTFTHSMRHYTWWNIGTRVGEHTTVTTVKVVR
jgi:YVTN family beta-propeller protein